MTSAASMLGESGFLFLDDRPWPYAVKNHAGEWWLYYWSRGSKTFVTMRKLATEEVDEFRAHALPTEKADLYFKNNL